MIRGMFVDVPVWGVCIRNDESIYIFKSLLNPNLNQPYRNVELDE